MQALSERLDELLAGSSVKRAVLLQFSALKTVTPSLGDLAGKKVESVGRRAKYLIFELDDVRLLMHLSQGGRIDVERPPKTTRPKGAVARIVFDDVALLMKEFGTERKAALWLLAPDDEGPFEGLGPEPFSREFEDLILTGHDGRHLHTMLRDQKTVAGIGRGFADDILHAARLSPFDSLKKLSEEQRRTLIAETHRVLDEALTKERQRTGGLPTKLTGRFTVHGKFGEPCPRCGSTLQRVSYESHEIAYCPLCQTGGKVLADRRMSRLLK